MRAVVYVRGLCVGSIDLDQVRLERVRAGARLSREEIIDGKLRSPAVRKELLELVRIYLDVPRGAQVRCAGLGMIDRDHWGAGFYSGDVFLCSLEIQIK